MAETRTQAVRPRRTLALALAVGIAAGTLLVGGCAADGAKTAGSSSTSSPAATTTTRETDDPSRDQGSADAEVHVTEPGDLPRQELRRAPNVGTTRVVMTQRNDVTVRAGSQEQSVSSPTITQTMEVEVSPRSDGRFDLRQEVVDAEVGSDGPASTRAETERSIKPLIGMRSTGIIEVTGAPMDLDVQLPDDLPPFTASVLDQLEGTFEQLSSPVPDEPLGLGGSWSTTSEIDLLGATVDVEMVSTITRIDAEGYTIHSETEMHADEDQAISMNGAKGTLLAFASEGSSESTVRFGDVVSQGAGRSSAHQSFEIDGQELEQDLTNEFRFRPTS